MPLQYKIILDLNAKITSLDFSTSGARLAAVTENGFINVWDLKAKRQFYPTPGPVSAPGRSCIIWLDEATFVCGFEDGYTLTGSIKKNNATNEDDLNLCRKRMADRAISILSFDGNTGLLAVGDKEGVRIWSRGLDDWNYYQDLPEPVDRGHKSEPLNVTCVEWIKSNCLLVSYSGIGVFVWDTKFCVIVRSFKTKEGRKICSGALCYGVNKFAAVNDLNTVDIYDINSGQIWSPPSLDRVYSVKALHRGNGFVVGRPGQAELVDIERTMVYQILRQGSEETEDRIVAISAHSNDNEDEFMVATISAERSIIWKTEEVGMDHSGHATVIDNHSSGWFSFISDIFRVGL